MHTELRQEAGTGLPADPLLDRLLRYFAQQPRQIPEPILPPGAQDSQFARIANRVLYPLGVLPSREPELFAEFCGTMVERYAPAQRATAAKLA